MKPWLNASFLDSSAISPVFLSSMDMKTETITITNDGDRSVNLTGYRICDFSQVHWFVFPNDYILQGGATVSLYCAAGSLPSNYQSGPYLQWRKKDGSLRIANVLNDGEILFNVQFALS